MCAQTASAINHRIRHHLQSSGEWRINTFLYVSIYFTLTRPLLFPYPSSLVYMLGQNIDSVIYQEVITDLAQKTETDSKKDSNY